MAAKHVIIASLAILLVQVSSLSLMMTKSDPYCFTIPNLRNTQEIQVQYLVTGLNED